MAAEVPRAAQGFTHAGGIVVHREAERVEVLLVRARRNPTQWVFPKGHVEPGESIQTAALREVREEAGVVGELGPWLGRSDFSLPGERCSVAYFLVTPRSIEPPLEERERVWLEPSVARARLPFEDLRVLLDRALDAGQA